MVFENRGAAVGATLSHPHGQIYAFDHLPPLISRKVQSLERNRQLNDCCLTCQTVVLGDPARDREVISSDHFSVAVPYAARWPYEVHVSARRHGLQRLGQLTTLEAHDLLRILRELVGRYDGLFGFDLPYIMCVQEAPQWRSRLALDLRIHAAAPECRQTQGDRGRRTGDRPVHQRCRARTQRTTASASRRADYSHGQSRRGTRAGGASRAQERRHRTRSAAEPSMKVASAAPLHGVMATSAGRPVAAMDVPHRRPDRGTPDGARLLTPHLALPWSATPADSRHLPRLQARTACYSRHVGSRHVLRRRGESAGSCAAGALRPADQDAAGVPHTRLRPAGHRLAQCRVG